MKTFATDETPNGVPSTAATLPPTWQWTTIGEICDVNPPMDWPEGLSGDSPVTFVPMAAVDERTGTIAAPEIRPLGQVWKGYKRFTNGDVLFAKITPCMENGKAATADNLANEVGLGSTEFHIMRPLCGVAREWIYYWVRQTGFRKEAERSMTGTAGQLRVPAAYINQAAIPIAPLSEQARIIDAIEVQLTRIDEATIFLDHGQATLGRYKASVLKAACEGRLVPQDPSDEPASELLKRILVERRAKWEAELRAKGKDPAKVKYEEPAGPDTEGLAELPVGWCWARFNQLIEDFRSGSTAVPQNEPSAYPILRSSSIRVMEINYSDIRYLPKDSGDASNFYLKVGNLLFTRLSGSLAYVGNCALVRNPDAVSIRFPDRIFCATLVDDSLGPYLELWFSSPRVREKIMDLAKSTAGHQRISMGAISDQVVALPPSAEQLRIVGNLEQRLSVGEELSRTLELSRKRAERLRQAILKRAFEGKLVSQDPSDEPASVLLERIRAERERERLDRGGAKVAKTAKSRRGGRRDAVAGQGRLPGM